MDWLKKLRQELGLTQEQAAQKIGISRFWYIDIELGRKSPSIKTAKKIAKAFSFDWKKFYESDESKSA